MSRTQKKGLNYFPLDVNFFSDLKVKILKAQFGADGITIYLYLLCEIYKKGYYIQVDDDFFYLVADDLNMQQNKIRQVINFLLSRSLFDNTLFQSDKVLTSVNIQKQYQESVKGRASKNPIQVKRFWLLEKEETETFIKVVHNENFSEKNRFNSENNVFNSERNDTNKNKGNKNKINKNKENNSINPVKLFEEFWAVYPRKASRMLAEQAYIETLLTTDWLEETQLLEAARNYADYCRILNKEEDYIKYASNWLKDFTWVDYLSENYKQPKKKETATLNNFNSNISSRRYNYSQLEKELLRN